MKLRKRFPNRHAAKRVVFGRISGDIKEQIIGKRVRDEREGLQIA